MKEYVFDELIDRRGTNCLKYDGVSKYFGSDHLQPMWVADMDFRTPDFILDALRSRLDHPIVGYSLPPETYTSSICQWLKDIHNWEINPDWLSYIPGVVKGIAFIIEYFTSVGDKIIIQPPVYHPFRLVPQGLRRQVVYNPLRLVNSAYEMDFDHLESIIDKDTKVLILSNPHNPAGVVWSRDTLRRLAEICHNHGVLVISDEIHAEMVYPEFVHYPFPTVSTEAASCSITLMAPSKTFNIAGIVSSYAIIPDTALRNDFYAFLHAGEFNEGTIFSYLATVAAYTKGHEWRNQMLNYVIANVQFVDKYLRANMPHIKLYMPQASFLLWLDCRELGLSHTDLVHLIQDKAGLALNSGIMFGKEGTGFMRMNIGCPRALVSRALTSFKSALAEI